MPWCPQCDEVFPDGHACPRCRAPMVEVTPTFTEQQAGGLPQLKVPRRIRRAFGRLSQPPVPPRQLLAVATALLLVAGGFALGRLRSLPADSPVVRRVQGPPLGARADGWVHTVVLVPSTERRHFELDVSRRSLQSGTVEPSGRLSAPFHGSFSGREQTRLVALGRSVALVLTDETGRTAVAAFPSARTPLLWLEGGDPAWASEDTLLLLESGGTVRRWSFGESRTSDVLAGSWLRLHQTPDGAALEAPDHSIWSPGEPAARLSIPGDGHVVAVGPSARRALVSRDGGLAIRDGTSTQRVSLDEGFVAHGAAFSPDGGAIAVTIRERSTGWIRAVVLDAATGAPVRTISGTLATWNPDSACAAVPAWDRRGAWVFTVVGDGSVYALEARTTAPARQLPDMSAPVIGCGVAWAA